MKRKGRHFETVPDIQRELEAVLHRIKEHGFNGAFKAWGGKKRDHCMHSRGDYFEGDGDQN